MSPAILDFVEFSLAGLCVGALYALTGIGFVVVYKATRIINFAIGEFMEQGKIVIDGTVKKLTGDRDVREFYLGAGVGAGGFKSFRDVKHYKRRKRWLS